MIKDGFLSSVFVENQLPTANKLISTKSSVNLLYACHHLGISSKADWTAEFEKVYHSNGDWVDLFRKAPGYICTELLRDKTNPESYITIDRWDSAEDFEAFRTQHKEEYEILDAQCEGLTGHEILLGKWESVNNETR